MMNQSGLQPIDEWEQYKVQETLPLNKQENLQVSATFEPTSSGDKWEQYKVQEKPSRRQDLLRQGIQYGSRAIESIIGLPQDLSAMTKGLINTGAEKLGLVSPQTAQKFREMEQNSLDIKLGSGGLRNISETVSKGYTAPKTPQEEYRGEIASDLALNLLPVGGQIKLVRPVLTTIGAHIAKNTAAAFGADEKGQLYAKMGAQFVSGLIQPGNTAKKYMNSLYKQADELLPSNAYARAGKFENDLKSLQKELKLGTSTPTKNAVLKASKELSSKIHRGRIKMDDLVEAKKNINELRGDPSLLGKGKVKFNNLAKHVDEAIESYGKTYNPEFLEKYRDANSAYGALQESKKFSNFMKNKIEPKLSKLPFTKDFTKAVPYMFLYGAGNLLNPKAAVAAAPLYGAYEGVKLAGKYANPVLRQHYNAVIQSALRENVPQTINNLRKLQNASESQSPSNKAANI